MTTFLYDDEMLLRYLLGTASETETTRLDELSLTDEACALALAQTENDLVDDYARDGLGAVEYAQFERHYLATLLRREKAHFALALQRLGQQAAAPSTANKTAGCHCPPASPGSGRRRCGNGGWRRRRWCCWRRAGGSSQKISAGSNRPGLSVPRY